MPDAAATAMTPPQPVTRKIDYSELADTLAATGLVAVIILATSFHIDRKFGLAMGLAELLALTGAFFIHLREAIKQEELMATCYELTNSTIEVLKTQGVTADVLSGLDPLVGNGYYRRAEFEERIGRLLGVARRQQWLPMIAKYAEIIEPFARSEDTFAKYPVEPPNLEDSPDASRIITP